MSPFEALYGRKAITPLSLEHYKEPKLKPQAEDQLQLYLSKVKMIQQVALSNYKAAQKDVKIKYDKKILTV